MVWILTVLALTWPRGQKIIGILPTRAKETEIFVLASPLSRAMSQSGIRGLESYQSWVCSNPRLSDRDGENPDKPCCDAVSLCRNLFGNLLDLVIWGTILVAEVKSVGPSTQPARGLLIEVTE